MAKTYTLHIDAYSPDTIPMARLARYMQNLAMVLGHERAVHFDGLKPGSTQLRTRIDFEDVPKVRDQLDQLARGEGTGEARKAWNDIDKLLSEDNASGALFEDDNQDAAIIAFPGVHKPRPVQYGPFTQEGTLDGVLVSIGGADRTSHLQLQNGDMRYAGLETDRKTARRLGHHLYEPIRVYGSGRWMREEEGTWTLRRFKVQSFEVLKRAELREAVDTLRAVPGSEWTQMDDPVAALSALRDRTSGVH